MNASQTRVTVVAVPPQRMIIAMLFHVMAQVLAPALALTLALALAVVGQRAEAGAGPALAASRDASVAIKARSGVAGPPRGATLRPMTSSGPAEIETSAGPGKAQRPAPGHRTVRNR